MAQRDDGARDNEGKTPIDFKGEVGIYPPILPPDNPADDGARDDGGEMTEVKMMGVRMTELRMTKKQR